MPDIKTSKGDLDFAADLFKAADKMRQNVEPSEYKHIVLGLIFLKYVSDAFDGHRAKLAAEDLADPEDPDEYLARVLATRKGALVVFARQRHVGKDRQVHR